MKISDIVSVKDSKLTSRYKGQKAQMGHFIEDYMAGKVDINMDFLEMMSNHKDEIFDFDYVGHHYNFFLTRMLPEVISHSKKQDQRIVRSHYDNKNDLFN